MPSITLRVRCFPTEDPKKVEEALLRLFPECSLDEYEGGYIGHVSSADKFREVIGDLRIRDTARGVMLRGIVGNRTSFTINKQVAYIGKVSFVENTPPLGGIEVVIEDEDLEQLIDNIAPSTVDGE
ncbi:MAG: hypothetical protein LUQ14_00460 [Methanomassiliicoccales archaeon]|nr:hypothetical protein [Methanomassiliicoccales archaeon]